MPPPHEQRSGVLKWITAPTERSPFAAAAQSRCHRASASHQHREVSLKQARRPVQGEEWHSFITKGRVWSIGTWLHTQSFERTSRLYSEGRHDDHHDTPVMTPTPGWVQKYPPSSSPLHDCVKSEQVAGSSGANSSN
uniref:Uncharacterized protein n=1 Tax=Knipowitschia caucasica TaxID=637954 RepID=A0AAV2JBQ8_KNICA